MKRAPVAVVLRVAALVVAVGLAAGCSHEGKTAEAPAARAPVAVAVAPVTVATVERSAPVVGAFFAHEEVTIAAELEARVAWIGPDMGDRVAEGDVLVRLDDAALRAQRREVEARLAKARADEARASELRRDGIIAAQEAERFRTDATVLAAQRDALAVQLDHTVIRAPLTGAIAQRAVAVGEVVKSGQALYTLVQDDPLRFRTPVPERFAGLLRIGQPIRLGVDAYPGTIFNGSITRINPTSTAANRSVTIEALIPNADGRLKPGFFAKGELVYDPAGSALAVPETALIEFAGVTKLFVVKDDAAEERVVRTGAAIGETEREVVDGIVEGEHVAISEVARLEDGAPVTVATRTAGHRADAAAPGAVRP